jgi:hypothetical protein
MAADLKRQLEDAQTGLVEALELAEDMIRYVPDYFRAKWNHDEDLAKLRRRVAALVLHVMDRSGDTKVMWSADNPVEVEAAQATFKRLKKQGYLAYTVRDDGEKGEVISEFDKRAGRIIMAPQLVGG